MNRELADLPTKATGGRVRRGVLKHPMRVTTEVRLGHWTAGGGPYRSFVDWYLSNRFNVSPQLRPASPRLDQLNRVAPSQGIPRTERVIFSVEVAGKAPPPPGDLLGQVGRGCRGPGVSSTISPASSSPVRRVQMQEKGYRRQRFGQARLFVRW